MLGTFIKASWDLLSTFIQAPRAQTLEKRRYPLPLPLRESHLAKIIILALSGKFLF